MAEAGDTLGYQDAVGEVEMLQWVEARHVADPSFSAQTASTAKTQPAPKVDGVRVEKV